MSDQAQPTTQLPSNPVQQQIQVNLDLLRKTKVHICMPCYGGMLTETCFMSYIKWANTCRQLGLDWTIETMTNESLITRARNTLVAKFLQNDDSTHLMFIDADIGWEPWHLLVMLNRDVDIIGGLYPMKSMPIKWCVNGFEGAEEGPDGLQEVSKTGTGFMLIKRHVFEKLNSHPAVKPFNNDIGLDPVLNKWMKTYFDTGVRENRYYSEDWAFCENWRDLGGKIWVDKRILLRHVGTYTFDAMAQEQLFKDLTKMSQNSAPLLDSQTQVTLSGSDATQSQPVQTSNPQQGQNIVLPAQAPASKPKTRVLASGGSTETVEST